LGRKRIRDLVVLALNNECSTSYNYSDQTEIDLCIIGGLKLTRETPPGECGRKVKLKGIDGGLYKEWSMWFNSTYRAKPYQILYLAYLSCLYFFGVLLTLSRWDIKGV